MRGTGGEKVRRELQHYAIFDEDPCAVWAEALIPTVTTTAQLLYPYNASGSGWLVLDTSSPPTQVSWLIVYHVGSICFVI